MKKDAKIYFILVAIVILIIVAIFIIKNNNHINEKLAKCIAERSELYVRVGCPACKTQEEIFGESSPYLSIIDCTYQIQECAEAGITGTPTWIINGKKYPGVKNIEKLKELTGC